MLQAQLESSDHIQERRSTIWYNYAKELEGWAQQHQVILPTIPEDCEQAYHLFYMLLPTAEHRPAFLKHLKEHEIYATFHYLPLNLSPMGQRFGGQVGQCPITEDISNRLVRLPLFVDLDLKSQERVIKNVLNFTF